MGPGAQIKSPIRLLGVFLLLIWAGFTFQALKYMFLTPLPSGSGALFVWLWAAVILLTLWLAFRYRAALDASSHKTILLILALALLVRLVWISAFPTTVISDFLEYDRTARMILSGQFQEVYSRPLGYPILLAMVYTFYLDPFAGRLLNALLGVLGVFFVYHLARKVGGPRSGVLAALFLALQPTNVMLTSVLCSEIGAASLFVGSAWLLLCSREQERPALFAAASGFLLGLSLLFRNALAAHLPWMIVVLTWTPGRKAAARWSVLALFLVGVILPHAALLSWHAAALGRFTWAPVQNNVANFMLLSGTNVFYKGLYNDEDVALYLSWSPEERTSQVVATVLQRISSHPQAIVRLAGIKLARMLADGRYGAYWSLTTVDSGNWSPAFLSSLQKSLTWLEQAVFLLLLVFAGHPWLRQFRKQAPFLLVFLASIFFTAAPHILLEAQPRYSHALVPLLCVAASLGMAKKDIEEQTGKSTADMQVITGVDPLKSPP